jgi:hypothetical protein
MHRFFWQIFGVTVAAQILSKQDLMRAMRENTAQVSIARRCDNCATD